MIRYFILMIMLYAILLTGCALMTQQPAASPTTESVVQVMPTTTTDVGQTTAGQAAGRQVVAQTVTGVDAGVSADAGFAVAQQTPMVQQGAVVPGVTSGSGVATSAATGQVPQAVPVTNTAVTATGVPTPTATPVDDSMDRVERRKMKQLRYAAGIDSLVQSHSFRFLPNSMQELPGGYTQLIYNELYFIGVFKDHVEVHMPTVRGNVVQYIEILNFDTFEVKNYQVSRTQFGWSISFNMVSGGDTNFAVSLMVYNQTGEAVLNLLTLSNTVRYVGYIQSLTKN